LLRKALQFSRMSNEVVSEDLGHMERITLEGK